MFSIGKYFQHGRSIRLILIGIVILSTVVRLGTVGYMIHAHRGVASIQDAHEYQTLAFNLLDHGVFSQSGQEPYSSELMRTPLYPVFLVSTFTVDRNGYLAIALQQILAIVGGILLFLIFLHRGLPRIGLLFSAVWMFEPLAWFNSLSMLTEPLFTFLGILLFYLLIVKMPSSAMSHTTAMTSAIVGVLLGLMILTRPVGLVWIPAVIASSVFFSKRYVMAPVIILCACLLVLSPWVLRNYEVARAFTVSSSSAFNFVLGFGNDQERAFILRPIEKTTDTKGHPFVYMYGFSAEAYDTIRAFQRDIATRVGISDVIERNVQCSTHVWFGGGYALLGAFVGMPLTQPSVVYTIELLGKLFWGMIGILAFLGTWFLVKEKRYALPLLAWGIIVPSIFINHCITYERMRIPIIPAAFLLAGFGLVAIARLYSTYNASRRSD